MIGFFEYILNHTGVILGALFAGFLYGAFMYCREGWVNASQSGLFSALVFGFILAPAILKGDQVDNNRHYATCSKYEAKQAGYIFSRERCYKPVGKDAYIQVNSTVKTKKDLLDVQ